MLTPKILLIDDEVPFLSNTAATLGLMGYEVSAAINGEQGLSSIGKGSYDVVVLDLRMPGISGMEVLKKIKPGQAGAPEVIILTGNATAESSLEGLSNGAFDYLAKPIKITDLLNRIIAAHKRKIVKERRFS